MKKLFLIIVLMAMVGSNFAQQNHYSFSEVVESGQTLYFLKRSYSPQEVWVTYPCYSGSGDNFYYGYDKPTGDLVIPPTITHNDTVYSITRVDFSAFRNCEGITSVVFPNTLDFIGQASFLSCRNLTGEIVIPDLVSIIECNAFSFCPNITSVIFGDSLREIRDLAFNDCYSLEHISGLPESLTNLRDGAFWGCGLRDSIVIPPHITIIEENVFSGCNIPSVVIPEGVTTIKNQAFSKCPIASINIPSTVTSFPESYYGAFHECTNLQYITVAEANPVYDSRGNCNALIETATNTLLKGCKNTVIPDDISIIAPNAFSLFNDLDSIAIPSSVERIEAGAFGGCNSLSTITLPSSVSFIGDKALACCGLTSIICKSANPPTAYNIHEAYNYNCSFLGVNNEIPIYIPFGTTEVYRNAAGWDYFSNFIETEMNLEGEWYYEIQNDNGSVTYQHLECQTDTVIENKRPKVIVRSNTQYDRNEITEVTHEYVYEENGKVYWWNKGLQEFTTLYNLNAEVGDEWEIKVGAESLIMHVDAVNNCEYEGRNYRMLSVSDPDDLFSGDIVCGIGHLTSFFPEKLMNRDKDFRVEGLRCYWMEDELVFKIGDEDCDAIYGELHGVEEMNENGFSVYPNPANDVLVVETCHGASLPANAEYEIANMMGQTLLKGSIDSKNPQIDINTLHAGMYFLMVEGETMRFVKR